MGEHTNGSKAFGYTPTGNLCSQFFLAQLPPVSLVELILYAATVSPRCRLHILRLTVFFALCDPLGIFSEGCICTSLCGGALGTFILRELECFRLVRVVNNTLLRR